MEKSNTKIEKHEVNQLIATRVEGKGDTWILVDDPSKTQHPSLTDALEAYFQKTKHHIPYRLDPLDSKLYAILTQEIEVEIIEEKPKEYGIYGMNFKQGI